MRVRDIEPERVYLAYCGSLAPVKVLESGVPYRFENAVAPLPLGVRVRALYDIPLAEDWKDAEREMRKPVLAYRAGDEFVIPARDVERPADRDVLAA